MELGNDSVSSESSQAHGARLKVEGKSLTMVQMHTVVQMSQRDRNAQKQWRGPLFRPPDCFVPSVYSLCVVICNAIC